ncbi:ABC transporter permease [Limisphaera sp. 4302-co]|uniref:ABC transporter permease n=1 Tax=Limisphaera sp. 4302-co TaxID=3400417 RepID=UPI003C284DF9
MNERSYPSRPGAAVPPVLDVVSPGRKRSRRTWYWAEMAEAFRMAMAALSAHKLRSGLTLLGVLVGVFSIMVTMTALRVLQRNVEREMSQLGAHTFAVRKWPALYFGGPEGFEKYWRRKPITWEQAQRVAARAELTAAIGVEDEFWAGEVSSRYGRTAPTIRLLGVTPGCFPARNWIVAEGRALTEDDVVNAREVCVLGDGVARVLFPFGGAVGQTVKMDGVPYRVAGVIAPKGGAQGSEQDDFVAVPLQTALNRYGRSNRSLTLLVQARDAAVFEDCVEEVRGLLRLARRVPPGEEDDFEIFSNDSLIEQFQAFTLAVRVGVAVISSIALVAAGVGIMNIMLVSVTERTREIGIRRAVGAKRRHILGQFILEAVVLCQVGGVLGILLGIVGGNLTAWYFKVPPALPWDWTLVGLLSCSAVGVVFGTYPALKAAYLDPIEALRYE